MGGFVVGGAAGVGARNYADLRDFGGSAGADVTAAFAAANTAISATGGVIFIPPAAAASTINSKQTIGQNVWIWGTGWDEGGGGAASTLAAGVAMTSLLDFQNNGAGIAYMNITDPAPFCTVNIINIAAASIQIIDCAVRAGGTGLINLPTITIGAGGRCRIHGGRITNADSTNAGSTGVLFNSGSSDHFIDGGARIVAPLSVNMGGGSNLQFDNCHFTGNTASTRNLLQTAGSLTCTNVQLDSCAGGASLQVIPGAATLAFHSFVGGRILNNNSATGNPLAILDCSAANSIGSLQIVGTNGLCDVANPAQAILRVLGTNASGVIIGGTWVGVSTFWDVANQNPLVCIGAVLLTGSPNPTTITNATNIIGSIFFRKTADTTVANSAAFANDGGMSFPIGANETWHFRMFVQADGPWVANTNGGIAFQITGPAAATGMALSCVGPGYVTAVAADGSGSFKSAFVNAFAAAIGGQGAGVGWGFSGTGVRSVFIIEGTIRNGANAGTVQLQHAQNVAVAGNCVVRTDSWGEAWRN